MTFPELRSIYDQPFFDLIQQSRITYLDHWKDNEVQLCTLLSIKTGGCSEDCGYCAQSSRYKTDVKAEKLMETDAVLEVAKRARENGSTRFCMGAAWKGVRDGDAKFEQVLGTIREVSKLGMEVCVTLGQLSLTEARKLKEAGVTAYNHNIDTSPEHYAEIVTTHTFQDRVNTIKAVQQAGMDVCCGGIIGMGESVHDRAGMLQTLASFDPHPESVPINALVAVEGTPLAGRAQIDPLDLVRMIATTRIVMPKSRVRLSAGRSSLSREAQILCLVAGANSIFYGEKLLTTDNAGVNADDALFAALAAREARAVAAS